MSIDSHLIHTCTTQRATTQSDAYKASKPAWSTLLSGLRCRLVYKAQRRVPDIIAEQPITTQYLLLVPAGTDIKPGDRVVNVVFEDGTTDAGPYRIEAVLPRRARAQRHISLQLEKAV